MPDLSQKEITQIRTEAVAAASTHILASQEAEKETADLNKLLIPKYHDRAKEHALSNLSDVLLQMKLNNREDFDKAYISMERSIKEAQRGEIRITPVLEGDDKAKHTALWEKSNQADNRVHEAIEGVLKKHKLDPSTDDQAWKLLFQIKENLLHPKTTKEPAQGSQPTPPGDKNLQQKRGNARNGVN